MLPRGESLHTNDPSSMPLNNNEVPIDRISSVRDPDPLLETTITMHPIPIEMSVATVADMVASMVVVIDLTLPDHEVAEPFLLAKEVVARGLP